MGLYHEKLFDQAVREVCIVTGELGIKDSLHPDKYLEAITKALDRGVEVKIVSGPYIDGTSALFSYLKEESRVKLFKLPKRPIKHFRIRDVDEKDGEGILLIKTAKGLIHTANSRIIKDFYKKFKKLQAKAIWTTINDFEII